MIAEMITVFLIYFLIYFLIFAYGLVSDDAATADANVNVNRCKKNTNSTLMGSYSNFMTGAKYKYNDVEFAVFKTIVMALVCFIGQAIALFVVLFVTKSILSVVATAATIFSRKFATERFGAMGSLLGYIREFIWINLDGTHRGEFMEKIRDTHSGNHCVAFNFMRIVRFNLLNAAYGFLLLLCIPEASARSTTLDISIVQYSTLAFGLINFVCSFFGFIPEQT